MILGGEFTKDLFLVLISLNGFLSKTMAQGHILGLGLLCSPMFPHMFLFSHPLGFVFLRGDICNKSGKHPETTVTKNDPKATKVPRI